MSRLKSCSITILSVPLCRKMTDSGEKNQEEIVTDVLSHSHTRNVVSIRAPRLRRHQYTRKRYQVNTMH